VTAAIPRDSRPAERLTHGTVQAIPNRHLVPVGTPLISEPLNVHDDYGPVNGQPLVLYPPSLRKNKADGKLLIRKVIPALEQAHEIFPAQDRPALTIAWS
jgi:hypothetical protein